MPGIAAIPVSKIDGCQVSDDGLMVLLKLELAGGAELVLALPSDQMSGLVEMAAVGTVQAAKLKGADTIAREVHTTTWWELGKDTATGTIILSLTLQAGGRLAFALPGLIPQQMAETLTLMTGGAAVPQPPPGTRLT